MIKKLLDGFYFGIGFIIVVGILFGVVWAIGFHSADEILGGNFTGYYTFSGNVSFKENVRINDFDVTPQRSITVFLDNSMNASEIQSKIDDVGKYLPVGNSVIFQFLPGNYILENSLIFTGFYGGGVLHIQGNKTELNAGDLHTNQEVFLDFSGQSCYGLKIQRNNIDTYIFNLHIKVNTDTTYNRGIYLLKNGIFTAIYNNYIEGTDSSTYGEGIFVSGSNGFARENYFSNLEGGIRCSYSHFTSYDNDDTGVLPKYGLWAGYGCTLAKFDVTQPAGSTANEYVSSGGVIR